MFYPYMTMGEDFEVTHTPWNGECTVVHFEKPDVLFCFKTVDVTVPNYRISGVVGFTNEEVSQLVDYCRHNAALLIAYSKCGGIANA